MTAHAMIPRASTGFFALLFGGPAAPVGPTDHAEDSRARRAFVQEALDRNPDAFRGAEDVQAMMAHFPGDF